MSYQWTRPDGKQELIDSCEPINNALDTINRQREGAIARSDRRSDASLWANYQLQLREWRQCLGKLLSDDLTAVREVLDWVSKRVDWWKECNTKLTQKAGLSPAQHAIFSGCPLDAQPHTWEQAALALGGMDEFRMPRAEKLAQAFKANADLLAKGQLLESVLVQFIEKLKDDLPSNGALTELDTLRRDFNKAMSDALAV